MSAGREGFDPELETLFGDDPELLGLARRVRASRPVPALDHRFKGVLRAQLMREAETALAQRQRRRRWFSPGMGPLAWGSGALGLALVGLLAFTLATNRPGDKTNLITYSSSVAANPHVSPTDTIEVAFSQPMDRLTVQRGVRIEPATQATYSWSADSKTLVIAPAHPLAGNTPYAVTIPKEAARSATGGTAVKDVSITFGTAAPPPPTQSGPPLPPALQPAPLGPVTPGSPVFFAPGGDPGSGSSTAGAPAASSPAPAPAPTLSTTGAAGKPSPSPPAAAAMVTFPAKAPTPVRLGGAATAVAFSPNQRAFASAVTRADGGSDVVLSRSDGTQADPNATVLASTTAPVTGLAWSDDATVVVLDRGAVRSVDLQGRSALLYSFDAGSASVILAPDGKHLFLQAQASGGASPASGAPATPAPAADGTLVDLRSQQPRTLPGSSSGVVAFSGDGATVAWVDRSQSTRRLMESATASTTTRQVPTQNHSGERVGFVALSRDAGLIAYQLNEGRVLIARSDGTVLATGGSTTGLTFSRNGDRVAYLVTAAGTTSLSVAAVPGSPPPAQQPASNVPVAAQVSLDGFIDAQIHHDGTRLAGLSVTGIDAPGATPTPLSRGYVISAAENPDRTVHATARLISDAGQGSPAAQLTDESLVLSADASGAWRVTSLTVPALIPEAAGPHVLHAQSNTAAGRTVLSVTFDADLQAGSVPSAISLHSPGGGAIPGVDVSYDPNTRTAKVTAPAGTTRPVVLDIATTLTDINGQSLARGFEAGL